MLHARDLRTTLFTLFAALAAQGCRATDDAGRQAAYAGRLELSSRPAIATLDAAGVWNEAVEGRVGGTLWNGTDRAVTRIEAFARPVGGGDGPAIGSLRVGETAGVARDGRVTVELGGAQLRPGEEAPFLLEVVRDDGWSEFELVVLAVAPR